MKLSILAGGRSCGTLKQEVEPIETGGESKVEETDLDVLIILWEAVTWRY
jgi:hypothetical protein